MEIRTNFHKSLKSIQDELLKNMTQWQRLMAEKVD